MKQSTEEMVRQILFNDIPHIQLRLERLEVQGHITIALVRGLILAVLAGAIAVLFGR